VGVGGQYPPLWPEGQSGSGDASRPKATIGWCGGGGVGGQRLHVAKSVLGGQSGEGRAKASPSRPFVASGWPEWGGAKASRLWPSLCGQWVAGVGPPCMASRWPVRGRGAPFPKGGRLPSLASGGGGGHRWPVRGRLPVAAPPLRAWPKLASGVLALWPESGPAPGVGPPRMASAGSGPVAAPSPKGVARVRLPLWP